MSYRSFLIKSFTFLGGLYFFLEFVLPETIGGVTFGAFHEQISNGFTVIGSMAVGLGLINLLMVHGGAIAYLRKGALNSCALLAGLFTMLTITALDWRASSQLVREVNRTFYVSEFAAKIIQDQTNGVASTRTREERESILRDTASARLSELKDDSSLAPSAIGANSSLQDKLLAAAQGDLLQKREECAQVLAAGAAVEGIRVCFGELAAFERKARNMIAEGSTTKLVYSFLFNGLFVPLGSAMFALLGFYIAAAAYRAFRVRTLESGLMMLAACAVILGQIPFGLWMWSGFPDLRLWLLEVPSAGAFRAIKIGAAVASLVLAFRMWFSIESESFSGGKS